MFAKLDLQNPQNKILTLDEYRVELRDNYFDLMGLTEAKYLNFLNYADSLQENPFTTSTEIPLSVLIYLS